MSSSPSTVPADVRAGYNSLEAVFALGALILFAALALVLANITGARVVQFDAVGTVMVCDRYKTGDYEVTFEYEYQGQARRATASLPSPLAKGSRMPVHVEFSKGRWWDEGDRVTLRQP